MANFPVVGLPSIHSKRQIRVPLAGVGLGSFVTSVSLTRKLLETMSH